MYNYLNDNIILHTYNSLPNQHQEEVRLFMQFLLNKSVLESKNEASNQMKKKRKIGYFPKGTFILSEDFDAPLEEFNEYMY